MKIKIFVVLLSLFMVAGCSAKSAEQHDSGVSVKMSESLNMKHISLNMYADGSEVFSENVVNADHSTFKKGEIVWFDITFNDMANSTLELNLEYSENIDGTEPGITDKLDVSGAEKWINVKFSEDNQLKLVDME
ncbi:hypothetical protein [Virgibacillus sp. YIM 98842]|uniref:hypothetical protein n=1 Tax=Virgibacillus sp. YIM 98842 TaxID=2663533 RepID=UPI0013DC61D7|nr:hypothetical protein [Virgibacillus sp. YIM 98842]